MSGKSALELLRKLCRDVDAGITPRLVRGAAIAAAVPAVVLTPACVDYGAPFVEGDDEEYDCTDGIDNDDDGRVDCYDDDCPTTELCLSCFDGVDNDGDGLADCSDDECAATEGCLGTCSDGEDSDDDGLIDCNDRDCAQSPDC